jgi:hypothetical protein
MTLSKGVCAGIISCHENKPGQILVGVPVRNRLPDVHTIEALDEKRV